jgi:hypothetical protein
MKVSCDEGLANHVGPESCGADRKIIVEALTDLGELSRTGESAAHDLRRSAAGEESPARAARARCGSSARRDLCGGRRATAVPAATLT